MTDPRSFLTRMLIVLVLVAILAVLMADHILFAFMGNPYLNGTIIAVALFGSTPRLRAWVARRTGLAHIRVQLCNVPFSELSAVENMLWEMKRARAE